MHRWELIEQTSIPDDHGVMELWRREKELVIRVNGRELMSSRMHGSEDALAVLACTKVWQRPEARVLVGGLGMGFTLAAALKCLQPDATVVVAELVPAVVRWNQGILADVAGRPLDDPRVQVHEGDVAEAIKKPEPHWDAVLLDVDNGPHGLTRHTNNWLYNWQGLEAAFDSIRPGGVLGVWSANPDKRFTRRLGWAGFLAEPHTVRARGDRGGRQHVVWIGVRLSNPPR